MISLVPQLDEDEKRTIELKNELKLNQSKQEKICSDLDIPLNEPIYRKLEFGNRKRKF